MTLNRLFVLILFLTYLTTSAQVTNVRKWRKTEKDSLESGLFLYDEKSYLKALPIFENIYSNHPTEEFIKYVYAKCGLYRADKHEDAYLILSEIYQKNKRVEDIQYDLGLAAHYNNKYDEALEYITAYLQNKHALPENRKNAEMLKQYITNGKYYTSNPTTARITNLGGAINSPDDEYTPAIKADESVLIFTYLGPKSIGGKQNIYLQPDASGAYMEDIYMTYKLDGEFTTAFPLDSLNTNAPDAAISLSNDGSVLFVYKNENDNHGDIYQSELVGEHYTKPKRLKGQVNSYAWEGHCSLSPDGKTLYFSSERGGGNGGRDIYKASLSEDGSWQHIVNLGDSINTPYDEDAPFIHPDGVTLFYSSNGRKSMGGYDVFKSTMNVSDSTFKKTENLGYPINSSDDDIYFVTAANGETAYYSSGRKGGKGLKDIYKIETRFNGAKPSLYLVRGEIQYDGDEVAANIKVEVISKNNKLFGNFTSNASSGSYLVSLPAGDKYRLTYSYKDFHVKTLELDLVGISGYSEKIHHVDFKDASDPVTIASNITTSTATMVPPIVKTELIKEAKKSAVEPVKESNPAAEAGAKAEAERIAKEQADAKAKADAEARSQADRIAREQAAAKAEAERVAKAKAEAERIIREQAAATTKTDLEAKAEAARLAKEQAIEKAKEYADAKAEAARIAKEQADAKVREYAEAKAQAERVAREQAIAKAKADAEAREQAAARMRAEAEAKAEADRIVREQALAKARAEAEIRAKIEAERIAKEQAAAKAKAEIAAQAKAEAERIAKEQAETKAKADAEAKAKNELIAKEQAATKAKADEEAKIKRELVTKEQSAVKAKADEEARIKMDANRMAKQQATGIAVKNTNASIGIPSSDGFVPLTRLHEKAIRYIQKYGDVTHEELEFRVQISAFKTDKNQAFPEMRKYGKIERVRLGDGYTRYYIGGSFKSLRIAFALCKRVVLAGQTDAFVSAFYKGRRLTYDELERIGIFK